MMKSLSAILVLVVVTFAAAAAESPSQILPSLQASYDQNGKAMDDGNIEAFMTLYADDFVGMIAPDTTIDREQVRETASNEMQQSPRPKSRYTVENVEVVDVDASVVATVLQTVVHETVDGQGRKGRKSLKVRYRDTVVKNGTSWQIKLRVPQ